MSRGMRIQITGLDRLEGKLKRLGAAASRRALGDALEAGAQVIKTYTRANIRARGLIDTGNLLDSIEVQRGSEGDAKAEAAVGTNVEYAAIHEFGGLIVPVKARALVFKTSDGEWHTVQKVTMPARPYLRPAVDEHRPEIGEAIGVTLENAIREAANG